MLGTGESNSPEVLRERKKRNDPEIFVCNVYGHCASAGQSLVAVDAIRHRGRIIGFVFAKVPRAGAIRALDGSVDEIPDSVFVAGWHWQPPSLVAQFGRNELRAIFCDGRGQPALYAAGDVYDLSDHSLDSLLESDPAAPGSSRSGVAVRIRYSRFRMVPALAADFRTGADSGAITARARSGRITPTGVCGRNAEADQNAIVADFSGTRSVRHYPARFGMARRNLRTP